MSNSKDFTAKVVVITGSSSGIGAVTAVEFSRAGAQVVVTGRNTEKLTEVAKQCSEVSPKGLKPLEVVADVSQEEDCKRLIDSVLKGFGKLNVLVNNAGFGITSSVKHPDLLKTFDSLMNTNLRSVVCLTQLSAEHLERTKGSIVNISSMAALKPSAQMGVYCTSKCALDMFTKCVALELGPKGIRVNIINPAAVKTHFGRAMGLNDKQYETLLEDRQKSYPLGRYGEPKDIANAVLFLASDESSFVTGTNLLMDGGALHASMSTRGYEDVNN